MNTVAMGLNDKILPIWQAKTNYILMGIMDNFKMEKNMSLILY